MNIKIKNAILSFVKVDRTHQTKEVVGDIVADGNQNYKTTEFLVDNGKTYDLTWLPYSIWSADNYAGTSWVLQVLWVDADNNETTITGIAKTNWTSTKVESKKADLKGIVAPSHAVKIRINTRIDVGSTVSFVFDEKATS